MCGTVASMATPRSRQAARLRARQRRAQQRARLVALVAVLGALGVVTLVLTAFGSGSPSTTAPLAAEPAVGGTGATTTRPRPEVLATVGNLRVQLPVSATSVTALGYRGSDDGALDLQPVGRQANEGVLARLWRRIAGTRRDGPVWYLLEGRPGTTVLAVGAAEGTDVYAPVDGSIVAISDVVRDGRRIGSRVDVRPTQSPSVLVSLTNLRPDPALTVGSPVLAATSKLGAVADIAAVEDQSLADHTGDSGNNVSISVYPSAGSL